MIKNYKMIRILTLILFAILFNSCKKPIIKDTNNCSTNYNDTSSLHPQNSQLKDLLNKYKQLGLPGISVYIANTKGSWIGSTGSADIANGVNYKPCHVQKVASLTKMFIGALLFKLIEDSTNTGLGYLSLSQPINKWIPEKFLKGIANADKITLAQCLNHSSGLYDVIKDNEFYLEVLNDPTKKWGPDDLLKFVKNKQAVFDPGAQYSYSNTNTLMVSLVIDFATGKPHHLWLREKILNPLNLNNTFYQHHENLPSNTAQGYFDLYQNKKPVNVSNYVTGSGSGYTGLYSNVYDLHKFLHAFLVDKTVVSTKSLQAIQTTGATDISDLNLGLGIMRKFQNRGADFGWGHTGRDLGYSADLFYFPARNASVTWCINYGSDAESFLKPKILAFQKELIDIVLQ